MVNSSIVPVRPFFSQEPDESYSAYNARTSGFKPTIVRTPDFAIELKRHSSCSSEGSITSSIKSVVPCQEDISSWDRSIVSHLIPLDSDREYLVRNRSVFSQILPFSRSSDIKTSNIFSVSQDISISHLRENESSVKSSDKKSGFRRFLHSVARLFLFRKKEMRRQY